MAEAVLEAARAVVAWVEATEEAATAVAMAEAETAQGT